MRQSKKQEVSVQPTSDLSPAVLTPIQVAKLLQVKPSWVYEQTRERAGVRNHDPLPHIKLGRYLRFRWPEIEAWLERQSNGNGKLNVS